MTGDKPVPVVYSWTCFDTNTMNSNRRNGKPASCEPCRLNKTRCDHTYPKCDRCRQRGIEERCVYHPAPLTRSREGIISAQQTEPSSVPRPLKRKRTINQTVDLEALGEAFLPISASQEADEFADAVTADAYRPGYLGPTSYAANLPKDDESVPPRGRDASISSQTSDPELAHQYTVSKAMRIQMATDILKSLRYHTIIQDLVRLHCEASQVGVIPMPLEFEAVKALKPTIDEYRLETSMPAPELVSKVLGNTSRPLDISLSTQPSEFYRTCTGNNLRFEMIGFILATAGRSLLFGPTSFFFKHPQFFDKKSQLVDELLRSSTICVLLCSVISPVNDIMIWMFYENLMLTSMMCGYSGPPTWRRLGELSSQIYALGLHKESNASSSLPLFILESRRKVFHSAFYQDKAISTFLGRPVRLSKRHTDVRMPLDVSDEELIGDPEALDLVIQNLDPNGWDTKGRYLRASWIRMRFISVQYREEILDFALAKLDQCVERQLLDISRRIHTSWDSIPRHLHYRSGCWSANLSFSVGVMLVSVYLSHWYNEFMIQKLLLDPAALAPNAALLRVSMDLLSTCLTLGSVRDRTYDIQRDFIHTILLYGIPSGSVLATALQEQHRTGQQFPVSISRAEIIRMLSVLISYLEAAAHLDAGGRSGDGNYNLCRKAARTFTRVIDAILDPKPAATPPSADLNLDLDFLSAPGLEGFEGMDFAAGGMYDGIDWGAIGQWTL
ncbi:hypothetical protein BDV95DRAFT_567686 [Massariosphaeria phaeospora]|uniref:Zn(2)-C6 fungal-type domain-containing protein n=1 Tax=Massariosphaeria phaeospora TaxID=100035 RepID=A0A7C8ICJ6_9PLEO|nr:hypothetical protein BDV95DRAFT_567686 [Massariosphaeria phaeospora]